MPYSSAERDTMSSFKRQYGPGWQRKYWASVNSGKVHGRGIKKPGHHGKHGRHRKKRRKSRARK